MTKAASELAHLFRAIKAPAAARALPVLADRAREQSWSYERFAEALLSTEVASRDSHGGEGRIKAARFPARKTPGVRLHLPTQREEDRRRAPRTARLPARAREREPARPTRSWFTVHLSAQGVLSRSMVGAGTLMASPLRRPRVTWMACSSPRWTLCKTVWRAQPSAVAASASVR